METFSALMRYTSTMCGEFTGHRWIPRTKASDAEVWCFCFICAWINDWVNNREAGDLGRHRGHYDVNVMCYKMVALCSFLSLSETGVLTINVRLPNYSG